MKQDHIVDTNKMVTAVEWLVEQLENVDYNPLEKGGYDTAKKRIIEKAKEMEKKQMIGFAEYVAGHPDKNRNYLGQMLHARSKYDEANRTVDLLEQYYKETYNK